MERRRFTTRDEGFTCVSCGLEVLPADRTSRNHCPRCLCSLHVDVNPGDRANACGGLMVPVGLVTESRRGYLIVHRCDRCGEIRRNRAIPDAPTQPDSMEALLALSVEASPHPSPRRPGAE